MFNIHTQVTRFIADHGMFADSDHVLVAVSGGADSVALLHLLISLRQHAPGRLGVAHVNHRLRKAHSDADASFVEKLALQQQLPFYQCIADARRQVGGHGVSLEEHARRLRYRALTDFAQNHGYGVLAVAHHADDNAESVLMALIRGSGPRGLSAMAPKKRLKGCWLVRPLLTCTQTRILDFVHAGAIEYRHDHSNDDDRFLRNRIRHQLLPLLRQDYNPKIDAALVRTASILRQEEKWAEEQAQTFFAQTVRKPPAQPLRLSIRRLQKWPVAVRRRIIRRAIQIAKGNLRRIQAGHIEQILNLLRSDKAAAQLHLPDRLLVTIDARDLIFARQPTALRHIHQNEDPEKKGYAHRLETPGQVHIPEIGGQFSVSAIELPATDEMAAFQANMALVDGDVVDFPLIIRSLAPGDRFCPLGLKGSRKVSRFLRDAGIPQKEKRRYPVVISGDKIIWVAGHRIDSSVKITPTTRKALRFELLLA